LNLTQCCLCQLENGKYRNLYKDNATGGVVKTKNVAEEAISLPKEKKAAGLAVVAVITIHCMHLLVNATQVLTQRHNSVYLDYGEVVQLALLPHSRRLSNIGLKTFNVFICTTQLGGNSVYVLLLPQVLNSCVKTFLVWTGVSTTTSYFFGSH
jgi:hypothetical protein